MWRVFLVGLAFFLFSSMTVFAAPQQGAVKDSDFSFRGVALGDTEQQLFACLGEPLFDLPKIQDGVSTICYTFSGRLDVSVSTKDRRVVDFQTDENFSIRDIKPGTTIAFLKKNFGDGERLKENGKLAYVYYRKKDQNDRAKLVFYINDENRSVTSMRLTSLPITQAEQESISDDERISDGEYLDGEIDLSGLPEQEEVRLGGLY